MNDQEPSQSRLLCMDCANNMIMDQRVLIKRDEYDKLNKIHNKIKDLIRYYEKRTQYTMLDGLYIDDYANQAISILKDLINV